MSKRSLPTKTRLKKASSYADNRKRQESDETRKSEIQRMLKAQHLIDEWNCELIGKRGWNDVTSNYDIREHFKNVQLETGIVIQMYMENPIKNIARNKETKEVVHIDFGVRQIDARIRSTDKNKWVTTPFPMIDKGIIMAVSPTVKMWYYEQREKLAKYDPKAAEKMIIPKPGDIVYTKVFQFKNARYYINKQKKAADFVMNQTELRLNNFQNLFLIDNYTIESIVRPGKENELQDKPDVIDNRYIELEIKEEDVINNSGSK